MINFIPELSPKVSVVIPYYEGMPDGEYYLNRCLSSIVNQTFKDYEILVTNAGKMAENTNEGIRRAVGEYIKILYMDDYFAHYDALQEIVDAFEGTNNQWLVTGCNHDPGTHTHLPSWNDEIHLGKNTIGAPSVLTIRNGIDTYFDEELGWLLDCDLYRRLYDKFGLPIFLNNINVTIGIHEGQSTHLMGEEVKIKEQKIMEEKYK